jgi:hypothetical protein
MKKLDQVIQEARFDDEDEEIHDTAGQEEKEKRDDALYDAISKVLRAGELVVLKALKASTVAIKTAMMKQQAVLTKKYKITPEEWTDLIDGELDSWIENAHDDSSYAAEDYEYLAALHLLINKKF